MKKRPSANRHAFREQKRRLLLAGPNSRPARSLKALAHPGPQAIFSQ
jgi:hypothetical protein